MTIPTSIVALFCEDIREEKSGALTILGVMPDNAQYSTPPEGAAVMAKLCIYVRLNFDPDTQPREASLVLRMPNGSAHSIDSFNDEIIARARREVLERKGALVSVVSQIVLSPFQFPGRGQIRVEAKIAGVEYLCGILNLVPVLA